MADPVLVHLGRRNRIIIDRVAHQQKFIPYALEAGKSQIKESACSGSAESRVPGSQTAVFLLRPHVVEGAGELCGVSLVRALIPS